ncbi:LLM class flavin-dependent oxidoreductase [Phenylobacterium sp. LjRoot225]|uniref:LLM class flavin-dependent oxidoreductase n=1 Tax=Phenylobacterium sp. LjRoot225 TaxID=3342285 RepID=UPI003ECD5219
MSQTRTSVMFDMRAPAFGTPSAELYAEALEMAAFADQIGVTSVNLMEHHASEDGYLPQPFVMGGGVAARTKRCRLSLGAVILPLHDPVKLAEQIAVLDLMSNGRLQVIFGAGYVAEEFAAFGVSLKDRGRLLDQGIEVILRALHGERFQAPDGRPVFVRPLPAQRPEDILLVGGGVEASAKRAARFGLGFSPLKVDLLGVYDAECRRLGREPGLKQSPGGLSNVHLSRDPEATWPLVMPHLKHVIAEYAKWAEAEPNSNSPFRGLLTNDEALKHCGVFNLMTPEQLLERAPQIGEFSSVSLMPLLGGLPPKLGWESLELLKSAMPKLQTPALATAWRT